MAETVDIAEDVARKLIKTRLEHGYPLPSTVQPDRGNLFLYSFGEGTNVP